MTLVFQNIRGVPLEKENRFVRENDNITSLTLGQQLDELLPKIEKNNMDIWRWQEQDAEQNHVILTKLNQLVDQVNL